MVPKFTNKEKATEARREVVMRRRVYPGMVAGGKMTSGEADRLTAIMAEIAEQYERADAPDLFDPAGKLEPVDVPDLSGPPAGKETGNG